MLIDQSNQPQQDPRQYVPPQGQTWTTHTRLLTTHKNTWSPITTTTINPSSQTPSSKTPNTTLYSLTTTPKFAIGQRAILIKTPPGSSHGNILWDCLTLLDAPTITWIKSQGGLSAIVISHPHYYASHLRWGWEFGCPVYVSDVDAGWCGREDAWGVRRLLAGDETEIVPGITAIRAGGHFEGSLVLHSVYGAGEQPGDEEDGEGEGDGEEGKKKKHPGALFIADTLVTVPSALYPHNRPPGTTSYGFFWSIPNMIPLSPNAMRGIWRAVEGWEFGSTHGAFVGLDVWDGDGDGGRGTVKERIRESMRIQARGAGWVGSFDLGEEWP